MENSCGTLVKLGESSTEIPRTRNPSSEGEIPISEEICGVSWTQDSKEGSHALESKLQAITEALAP